MIQGIGCAVPETASAISAAAFEFGLVIETAGPEGEVVKALPPLVTPDAAIDEAFAILRKSCDQVASEMPATKELEGSK